MKRLFITVIAGFSVVLAIQSQNIVKGYVYEDINHNHKKERSEKGIPKVAVSNGQDVVLTDEKGYYELMVGDDNIIFVIKPSGYELPLNECNQPQFYYIHKPNGSPESYKYKGLASTGQLPKSVDFGLLPAEQKNAFTSLIYGDPQPYNDNEIDYFRRGIVEETKRLKNLSFGLTLGDLVGDTLDLHKSYIGAVKENGLPWFNVMGNHDMNYEAVADSLSDETFEANFGPATYAFNYGKAHFIVMDDIIYPDPRDNNGYWGGFRPGQLEFLKNDLKYVDKDRLIVIAFHIPLFNENGDTFRDSDRKQLFNLLHDYPNALLLSAHTHYQMHYFHGKDDGCLRPQPIHEYNVGTTSGDWYSGALNAQGIPVSTMRDGTPKGYLLLNIDGNKYTLDYRVAGKPADYQIAVYTPRVLKRNKRTSASIYANFFIGYENDKVEYRVDNGEWKTMRRIKEIDPDLMRTVQDFDYETTIIPGKRPSNPVQCTHLWNATIPTHLSAGNHTVEVKATDMFGRTHFQTTTYRLEE